MESSWKTNSQEPSVFENLPRRRGLDPLYFHRRRSLEGALRWSGAVNGSPRTCIDVGANIGQTLQEFLNWWPSARCISFEPLPDAFGTLLKCAESNQGRAVARNIGISDETGTLKLFASRSQSTNSSFKRLNRGADTVTAHRGLLSQPSALELSSESDEIPVDVSVTTLDDHLATVWPESLWAAEEVDILKSDTQGWDLKVLRGARTTLLRTRVVLVEWIFDDVYGSPTRLHELDLLLSNAGFRLWDVSHVYKDLTSMRTLWADFIYARPAVDQIA